MSEEIPQDTTSPHEGESTQDPPQQKQEEEVKSNPTPVARAAPQYRVVKEGYIQRQGHLWKKWYKQWMTLDEDGASLRWYKTETRSGNDGTLYMSKCAEVCDPREGITTAWPEGVANRCFVVCSPNRAHYIVADSEEDKKEWVAKLLEAKAKFNTTGVGIVSVDLFSVEALKVSFNAEMERAQGETNKLLASEGTSTEQVGKDLDKAVKDAEKQVKGEQQQQPVEQVAAEPEPAVSQAVETEVQLEAATESTADEPEETDVTPQAPEETAVEVAAAGDTGDEEEPTVEVAAAEQEEDKEDSPPADDGAGKEE